MVVVHLQIALLALILTNYSCHAFQAPLNRLQHRSIYQANGFSSSLMQRPRTLAVDLNETPRWLQFRKQVQRIGDVSRQLISSPAAKGVILPLMFQVILVSVFNVHPVLAAATASATSSPAQRSKVLRASARTAAVAGMPKWYRVLRKMFLGASGKSVKSLKAGDTRFDGSSVTTFVSSMLLLAVGVFFASFLVRWEEDSEFKRMKKEVARENEYRENMVFDAVDAILRRLKDPNIKPALKKELLEQLKDLDAKGEIQLFLAGKGPRPDVGTQMQANIKRKQKMKEQRQKQQQQQQQQQQPQKPTNNAPSSSAKTSSNNNNNNNNNNKPPSTGVRGRTEVRNSGDRNRKNKAQKGDEEEEEEEEEHDGDEDDEYIESDDEEDNDDDDEEETTQNTRSSNQRANKQSPPSKNLNKPPSTSTPTSTSSSAGTAGNTASSLPSSVPAQVRQVLTDLDTSLRTSSEALSESQRRRLTQELASALSAIQSAEKQQVAIQRIRQRIGDVDYWRDYLEE